MASIIVIAAFAVFSFLQYNSARTAMVEKLESDVAETSVALSHQIANWLNGKLALINMMAGTMEADFSMETIQKTMETPLLKEEFILIFGAMETDGKPISNTPTWYPGDGWDGRLRPWYPLAQSKNGAVLTDPYVDSATQDILISAVCSIKDRGMLKGAFGGDLSLKNVSDTLNTLNFNNTGYAFLLNADKNIISHPDTGLNGKPLNALFSGGVPELGNRLQELSLGGKTMLVQFAPIERLQSKKWLIGVVLDKDKALAEVEALKFSGIIGMLISGLISSLVIYLTMSRLLLTPINNLIATADEISKGKMDFEIKETARQDEIGLLAKAFERMGFSIRLAMKKLQEK